MPGFEPAIPFFPARHSNQSAIETVNDLLLKLLVNLFTLLSINTCDSASMKMIMVGLFIQMYVNGNR